MVNIDTENGKNSVDCRLPSEELGYGFEGGRGVTKKKIEREGCVAVWEVTYISVLGQMQPSHSASMLAIEIEYRSLPALTTHYIPM